MAKSNTSFEDNAQQFYDYSQEIRGHARYELVRWNLEPYLSHRSLHVADIGGGSGPDTFWLASLGHEVTLVEPAKQQLMMAEQRLSNLDAKAQGKITLIEGTTADLDASLQGSFDLVLSHGVAMYLDEPKQFVDDLAALTKPWGFVSLVEKGYYGAEARLVRERKFEELELFKQTKRLVNNQDRKVWAFKPEELARFAYGAGMNVVSWSGVRVITDDMHDKVSELNDKTIQAIVDAEYKQGHNPEIRGQGQMLHFIAQKR